jgi:hypothetical protein
MKTTIEIADGLLEAAQKAARQRGTTLRALVELGLRQVIARPPTGAGAFKLRRASVPGEGLRQDADALGWDALRELSYGDRGR